MIEQFGTGETPVERATIAAGDLRARVITWGAVVQDLRLAGHAPALVLGFDRFEDYPTHSRHFGAIAGRVANRIAHARFSLDGRELTLDRNFAGSHHLHGGSAGFGVRLWRLADHGDDFVTLAIESPDGDMGYPGRLEARCTYRVAPPATLVVELEATSDAPTLCNLAHHSYFNLEGRGDVLDHLLRVDAERVTAVDADLIPTGELTPVAGTPLDFRTPRPIRVEGDAGRITYDHNYCLADAPGALRLAARLEAPGGVALETWTTEPGLQVYDAAALDVAVPGLDGQRYGNAAGICLEAQRWPDAPNHPAFPSAELRPGERYRQHTEYRFEKR